MIQADGGIIRICEIFCIKVKVSFKINLTRVHVKNPQRNFLRQYRKSLF